MLELVADRVDRVKNLICKCLYVAGMEVNEIVPLEPVPEAVMIDSYELRGAVTPSFNIAAILFNTIQSLRR